MLSFLHIYAILILLWLSSMFQCTPVTRQKWEMDVSRRPMISNTITIGSNWEMVFKCLFQHAVFFPQILTILCEHCMIPEICTSGGQISDTSELLISYEIYTAPANILILLRKKKQILLGF